MNATRFIKRPCSGKNESLIPLAAIVDIAIPCYNQAAFLIECINSLQAQSFQDWEAFIVDDCSPQGGIMRLVQNYKDSRLHFIRHETNRGLAASRNTAIKAGSSPLLLCLDADDFLHPEFLASTVTPLLEGTEVDCVFTDFQLVGAAVNIWTMSEGTPDQLAKNQWIPGAGTLMRREVWNRAGGYCESSKLRAGNEDWDFWISAIQHGLKTIHVPEPLYFYRRHSNSMSVASLPSKDWQTRMFILHRHPEFFAVGSRRAVFRSEGYLKSAALQRAAGNLGKALLLKARAVAERPMLLGNYIQSLIKTAFAVTKRITTNVLARLKGVVRGLIKPSSAPTGTASVLSGYKDWDASATEIHRRYGYLSHDYAALDEVIAETSATSVLEIGCGSGRLIPVYLKNALDPIWAQDVSTEALKICQRRFHPQANIRYFPDTIDRLVLDRPVDLIVSTRVLQHILDEDTLWKILKRITPFTNAFFVNESEADSGSKDPFIKPRDYGPIFEQLGFRLRKRGIIISEQEAKQSWGLFVKQTLSSNSHA